MSDELKRRLENLRKRAPSIEDPRDKMTRRMKLSELDSYNEFVDRISQNIPSVGSAAIGKMLGQAPKAFKTSKPVFKTGTKEKIKNLKQDMSRGGEADVVDLTTEMVIDE
jgi:hypothetical protein